MSVILVTGGNRGLGYAMVQVLGLRIPDTTIIIGCRDASSGEEAIVTLQKEGVSAPLDVVVLDIEDDESIASAVRTIDAKYGKLDGKSFLQPSPKFHYNPQHNIQDSFSEVANVCSPSQQRSPRPTTNIPHRPPRRQHNLQLHHHLEPNPDRNIPAPSPQSRISPRDNGLQRTRKSRPHGKW